MFHATVPTSKGLDFSWISGLGLRHLGFGLLASCGAKNGNFSNTGVLMRKVVGCLRFSPVLLSLM